MTDNASRDLEQPIAAATVWVVLGSSGEYSDWRQWAVCVCLDEQTAKDRVGRLSSDTRIHWAAKPAFEWWRRAEAEAEMAAWKARCIEIDDGADEYDQPNYQACEVPLIRASADAADSPPSPQETNHDT